ncbi:MAG: sialidase family protein [Kiritimatiellae bacterium]|nr:sialidase family protein [Kiritimatiellia bacterium]
MRAALLIGACMFMNAGLVVAEGNPLIGNPKVVVPSPDNNAIRHLSWPKLVRADNGTLVLAYSAGIGHNKGASGLAVSLSEDGGRSFSPPELLCYYPKDGEPYRDVGNLALGMGNDGAVILLAMAYDGDKANTILGWRSLDHGKTWQSTDTSAIGNNKTGSVFGHVFAVPRMGMAVCGHYRKPKGAGIWISYSSDNGKSWGPPQTITSEGYNEPVFIHTDGGRLVGLVRQNEARAYHQFVSRDIGKSWQFTERAIQGNVQAVHPSPFLTVDPSNPQRLYALVSEREPSHRISLWYAHQETLQWRRIGVVVTGDGDWTYPWMTHLAGNEWFVVYYKGSKDAASIYGARMAVPEQEHRNEPNKPDAGDG